MWTKVNWKWPNHDRRKVQNVVLCAQTWLRLADSDVKKGIFWAHKNKVWFSAEGDFKSLEASLNTSVVIVYNQSALIAAVSES